MDQKLKKAKIKRLQFWIKEAPQWLAKRQRSIQKLFNKGKIDNQRYFSTRMLLAIKSVRAGIKGENPNRRHDPATGRPLEGEKALQT